jgi:glycosyltransferase involved in cell wall biosynthesis
MRVLFVSQYFWPESFRANDIAFELARRGHQVTVLTAKPNYPKGEFYEEYGFFKKPEENVQGVRIMRAPIIPRGRGRGLGLIVNYISFVVFGLLGALFRVGREYDVIFVHQTSPILAAIPAMWVKKRLRIPLVMWVLDLWPESVTAASSIKSPWVLGPLTRLVKWIYAACDAILISSRSFAGSVCDKLNGRHYEPEYFPNWAEDVFTAPPVARHPLPVSLPEGFNVMFAGNLGEAQDFETILNAAGRTADKPINWLLVGTGRKAEWISEQIQARGLKKVFMLGHHPIDRMPGFFSHADAMLLSLADHPLFRLTVPAKLQAYMASGKVIIGVLAGEGAEVLRESGAGLAVSPGDAKKLAEAVTYLAGLPDAELSAMGAMSRRYYDQHFSREDRIAELEKLFQKLVGERPMAAEPELVR